MSEPAPLAARALLLDIAAAGDRLVAVGDHGDIVVSADQGRIWRQSLAPTHALLTGVCFAGAKQGWAVGHQGVILHTSDGGDTWERQDDRKHLDDVHLDVLFRDEHHGFVVGAYGKFLVTADGGRSWTAGHPTADEVHYNRITAGPDGALYLSGESGTTLISRDDGATWTKADVPYDGSLFGVLPLGDGRLLTYGLRGHVLRSDDRGATWSEVPLGSTVLIMAGRRLADGRTVLAGQGGNFFVSRDGGRSFTNRRPAEIESSIADLIGTADGAVVTVGEAGAVRLNLP
ncbi:MAG TPA: YCF48-related protein [Lacunisphaera sp.]|nr:YCF48-related protein [Lacunisphaera sp.]